MFFFWTEDSRWELVGKWILCFKIRRTKLLQSFGSSDCPGTSCEMKLGGSEGGQAGTWVALERSHSSMVDPGILPAPSFKSCCHRERSGGDGFRDELQNFGYFFLMTLLLNLSKAISPVLIGVILWWLLKYWRKLKSPSSIYLQNSYGIHLSAAPQMSGWIVVKLLSDTSAVCP